jgi:hypothetical protein
MQFEIRILEFEGENRGRAERRKNAKLYPELEPKYKM